MVVAINKVAIPIKHIGEATGHTGTEIAACWAEHSDYSTGHIFAAVITGTLHDHMGTGITYRQPFTGTSGGKQPATGCSVETGITNNHGLIASKLTARRRTNHQLATTHAFADIVVGIAFEQYMQATSIPDSKTLSGTAGQFDGDRLVGHALIAISTSNLTGESCPNGAITVADTIGKLTTTLRLNSRQNIGDHLLGHTALIERGVTGLLTTQRLIGRNVAIVDNWREIKTLMARADARLFPQQIAATNQLIQTAITHGCQPFPHLLSQEGEEVHHHLHGAVKVLVAQIEILSRNPRGTVI